MLAVADPEKDFREIPSHVPGCDDCVRYRQMCDYLDVCNEVIKPERHNARLKELEKQAEENSERGKQIVSNLLNRKKKKTASKKKAARKPAAKKPAPEPEVEADSEGWSDDVPPWYKEGCKVCKDRMGFTRRGGVCPGCGSNYKRENPDYEPGLYETMTMEEEGETYFLWREAIDDVEDDGTEELEEEGLELEEEEEEYDEEEYDEEEEYEEEEEEEEEPEPAPKRSVVRHPRRRN